MIWTHDLCNIGGDDQSWQIYDLSYTIFHIFFTFYGYITNSQFDKFPLWLNNSVVRALQRYRRGYGFESRSGLKFFKLLFHNCVSCAYNCDDQSRLHIFLRSSIYDLSYIHLHLRCCVAIYFQGEQTGWYSVIKPPSCAKSKLLIIVYKLTVIWDKSANTVSRQSIQLLKGCILHLAQAL